VKCGRPEILIIINERIKIVGTVKLIHEIKSEDELCVIMKVNMKMETILKGRLVKF